MIIFWDHNISKRHNILKHDIPIGPLAKKIENKTISKCLTRYLEQWDLERNMEKQEFLNLLKRVLFDGDEDTCNKLNDEVKKIKESIDEATGKEKKNMERVCTFS